MTTAHSHDPFPIDSLPDEITDGHKIDKKLIGDYVGAAYEGCRACQEATRRYINANPNNVAVLVYIACNMIDDTVGGLPPSVLDKGDPFGRLAAAGVQAEASGPLFDMAAEMSIDERGQASDTAMDTIIGYLSIQ